MPFLSTGSMMKILSNCLAVILIIFFTQDTIKTIYNNLHPEDHKNNLQQQPVSHSLLWEGNFENILIMVSKMDLKTLCYELW